MLKKIFLIIVSFVIINCGGTYTSNVTPGYEAPKDTDIAISYLYHPDFTISYIATGILDRELKSCYLLNFINAEKTKELLKKNNIDIQNQSISKNFIMSLKNLVPAKFLMIGYISDWRKGGIYEITEVSLSLAIYEIETGNVVWKVSGSEKGNSGWMAESPDYIASKVLKEMLKKWPAFCKSSR